MKRLFLMILLGALLPACNDSDSRLHDTDAASPAATSTATAVAMEPADAATPDSAGTASQVHISGSPVDNEPPAKSVHLAYFHVPPDDGTTVDMAASEAGLMILTRGDERYRDELRASGFNGSALQFVYADEVHGPGPYADASAACDPAFDPRRSSIVDQSGDFCAFVHPNEDWFLHNGAGQRLFHTSSTGVWYHMNPASFGWRQFATQRLRNDLLGSDGQPDLGYDGIMLGDVELSLYRVAHQVDDSDGMVREFADDASYRAAWTDYLRQLSDGLRSTGELWGMMIADSNDGSSWNAYLPYLDGGVFLAFATGYHGLSADDWTNQLRQAESAVQAGKGIVAVSNGEEADSDLQRFALGSYLLISENQHSYFRYVSNADGHEYTSFWLYPNYNLRLGAPAGARYQLPNGTWRRDFECGFVTVNPLTRDARITETCSRSGG